MRGSPPVQLALLLAAFIGLSIPLMQLTTLRANVTADSSATTTPEAKATPTTVRVRFAHKPDKLSVKIGNQELLHDTGASPIEESAELLIPKEGIELHVLATWPAGTPDTAVSIELEPDALDAQSRTLWSSGSSLDEIIPFQWKP